jgi:hypothetical protein
MTTEVRAVTGQPVPVLFPLGNALDGVLLDNVNDVSIGGTTSAERNVISGNEGRGIEVRGYLLPGSGQVTIGSNLIGTDITGQFVTQVDPTDPTKRSASLILGNLGDGIFLLNATGTVIQGTAAAPIVVSGNRGFGIHAVGDGTSPTKLKLSRIFVGTDQSGNQTSYLADPTRSDSTVIFLGNGSDGVFLDRVVGTRGVATVSDSVVSGNRSNGIDLLDSSLVTILRNNIGSGLSGSGVTPGNSATGIFLNDSSDNTVGGTAADANTISGNQVYGVAISAPLGGAASRNLVAGNRIGLDGGGNQLANGVSGVLINNARDNTIGGSVAGSANTISGNQLYGIQISTGSADNKVWGNQIGTGLSGLTAIPNNSDGVFLIDAPNNQIGGLDPTQGNTISGNRGDGIGIFGTLATGNRVANNLIGLGKDGTSSVANRGSGVLIDNAGGGKPDLNTIGPGNVISGNNQSGITVSSTLGPLAAGNMIVGNKIGTDRTGGLKSANGGNGVFLFGASRNTIGGASGDGNLISGNALSGIVIFSPASGAPADFNLVLGNKIGTSADGLTAVANQSDGIQMINANNNTIGSGNVISGNGTSGVEIDQQPERTATGNLITGNLIGTNAGGLAAPATSSQRFGVLVSNAQDNSIGATDGATIPGTNVPQRATNVISGNLAAGIDLTGTATGNAVWGNYIGLGQDGTVQSGLGNPIGVLIDNTTGNLIGGDSAGVGNIISESPVANSTATFVGIQIQGPPNSLAGNVVQGNLIGIAKDKNGTYNAVAANQVGVLISNSSGNIIGGTSPLSRNVISDNSLAGVQIFGQFASGNQVLGNFIGTDITGNARPESANPLDSNKPPIQSNGVFILAASRNTVGPGNLISGNLIGVNITGQAGGGQNGQAFGTNVVKGNYIGTSADGMRPVPNFQLGVFINDSIKNTIGGSGNPGNLISANGIAGVEIFGGSGQQSSQGSRRNAVGQGNTVAGNTIGPDANGNPSFTSPTTTSQPYTTPDGVPVNVGYQQHGVVVVGSSNNTIGAKSRNAGNLLKGNIYTGVFISRRDFAGNIYAVPVGNQVLSNTIDTNGIYGAFRFDARNNNVAQRGASRNTFRNNPINVADYITGFNSQSPIPAPGSKLLPPRNPKLKGGAKRALVHPKAAVPVRARPTLPSLFGRRAKPVRVFHSAGGTASRSQPKSQ